MSCAMMFSTRILADSTLSDCLRAGTGRAGQLTASKSSYSHQPVIRISTASYLKEHGHVPPVLLCQSDLLRLDHPKAGDGQLELHLELALQCQIPCQSAGC